MARKPRISFPGAIYHVISRGNYRKDLFEDLGSREAFENSLFEAADFCNWLLHAYAIMSNHYHAIIETPDANLSEGMQWLQGTFANRFNRFRGEHGHVFQGRFKSPLVEPGDPLRRVVDYVHLNPVRAGILSVTDLRHHMPSSYAQCWREQMPSRLVRTGFLGPLHLPNNLEGMKAYEKWLETREEGNPEKQAQLREEFEGCWIMGSEEFRRNVQTHFDGVDPALDWGGLQLHELRERQWEEVFQRELRIHKMEEKDLSFFPKLAPCKIDLSRRLREQTTASNRWIAERLQMGHPSNVSRYLRRMPKSKG